MATKTARESSRAGKTAKPGADAAAPAGQAGRPSEGRARPVAAMARDFALDGGAAVGRSLGPRLFAPGSAGRAGHICRGDRAGGPRAEDGDRGSVGAGSLRPPAGVRRPGRVPDLAPRALRAGESRAWARPGHTFGGRLARGHRRQRHPPRTRPEDGPGRGPGRGRRGCTVAGRRRELGCGAGPGSSPFRFRPRHHSNASARCRW